MTQWYVETPDGWIVVDDATGQVGKVTQPPPTAPEDVIVPMPPAPPPEEEAPEEEEPEEEVEEEVEVEAEEPPLLASIAAGVLALIIGAFNGLSSFFYQGYLEVLGWIWPFNQLAGPLYSASTLCADLAWNFYDFSVWVDEVSQRIAAFLSWDVIWSYIISYIPNLEEIRDWFYSWWTNTWSVISSWWTTVQPTVQGWIDAAAGNIEVLIDTLRSTVYTLSTAWDNFAARIPTLEEVAAWWSNWTGEVQAEISSWWTSAMADVEGLIDSAFIARASFWEGWQDWRDQVVDFITNPLDWIAARFESWFWEED